MATTTKAISGNATKRDTGAVLMGGTIVGTKLITPSITASLGHQTPMIGKPAVVSNYTQKAVSGSPFAFQKKGYYVIVGNTPSLGGVANTDLKSSYAFMRRPVAYLESRRSTDILTIGFNYRTGRPISALSVSADSFGTDDAARPTRSVPGEFTYQVSGKGSPTNADYAAKTGA